MFAFGVIDSFCFHIDLFFFLIFLHLCVPKTMCQSTVFIMALMSYE
jgi:hypothetical protein